MSDFSSEYDVSTTVGWIALKLATDTVESNSLRRVKPLFCTCLCVKLFSFITKNNICSLVDYGGPQTHLKASQELLEDHRVPTVMGVPPVT